MHCAPAPSLPRHRCPQPPAQERRQLLSFVICGGGPTGVEVAAELHDLIKEDLVKLYPNEVGEAPGWARHLGGRGRMPPSLPPLLLKGSVRSRTETKIILACGAGKGSLAHRLGVWGVGAWGLAGIPPWDASGAALPRGPWPSRPLNPAARLPRWGSPPPWPTYRGKWRAGGKRTHGREVPPAAPLG